jgi:predicted aldo/keto reductase-like oxidoreductase
MWVLRNQNVACTPVGMNAVQDVVENCAAVAKKITGFHRRLLEQYAAAATGDYCRMCETCMPGCPAGIRIADILRFRMYHKNYGHANDARELYAAIPAPQQAPACTRCGRCEQTCPNRLSIVEKLQEAHALLTGAIA